MTIPEPESSRPEMAAAAWLYLMAHYARSACPRLALCIARHMQCLATYPEAAPVLRGICCAPRGARSTAAIPGAPPSSVH